MESMNIQDSFSVFPCHSIRPVSLLLLLHVHVLYFTLQFVPLAVNSTFLLFELAVSAASHRHCQPILLSPPFTRCLYSPDLLFPLLVFDFASQSHASCAFFLVLTSCLAFSPGPPPASRRLQQCSLNCTASDEKLSAHVNSCGTRAKAETRADLRGWSEHSRVRTYKLVGHTFARVTLPVTCTVSYTCTSDCSTSAAQHQRCSSPTYMVSVTWAVVPSCHILQLSERFSYSNTLRSQRVWISYFLLSSYQIG